MAYTATKYLLQGLAMKLFTVGDVVKRLREMRGWSQQELADAATLSVATVGSLEDPETADRATRATIQKVATALNVSEVLIYQAVPAVPDDVMKQLLAAVASHSDQVKASLTKVLNAPTAAARKARH